MRGGVGERVREVETGISSSISVRTCIERGERERVLDREERRREQRTVGCTAQMQSEVGRQGG